MWCPAESESTTRSLAEGDSSWLVYVQQKWGVPKDSVGVALHRRIICQALAQPDFLGPVQD